MYAATSSLRAAKAAISPRAAGWTTARDPCLAEMPRDGDLPRCIQALLIVARACGAYPLRAICLNGTHTTPVGCQV